MEPTSTIGVKRKKASEAIFAKSKIKRLMQLDSEVGNIGSSVPSMVSKCVELFLAELARDLKHHVDADEEQQGQAKKGRKTKTITTKHIRELVQANAQYEFIKDIVTATATSAVSPSTSTPASSQSSSSTPSHHSKPPSVPTSASTASASSSSVSNVASLQDDDSNNESDMDDAEEEEVDDDGDDDDDEDDELSRSSLASSLPSSSYHFTGSGSGTFEGF